MRKTILTIRFFTFSLILALGVSLSIAQADQSASKKAAKPVAQSSAAKKLEVQKTPRLDRCATLQQDTKLFQRIQNKVNAMVAGDKTQIAASTTDRLHFDISGQCGQDVSCANECSMAWKQGYTQALAEGRSVEQLKFLQGPNPKISCQEYLDKDHLDAVLNPLSEKAEAKVDSTPMKKSYLCCRGGFWRGKREMTNEILGRNGDSQAAICYQDFAKGRVFGAIACKETDPESFEKACISPSLPDHLRHMLDNIKEQPNACASAHYLVKKVCYSSCFSAGFDQSFGLCVNSQEFKDLRVSARLYHRPARYVESEAVTGSTSKPTLTCLEQANGFCLSPTMNPARARPAGN
jgi:hypothetical protein